MLDRIPWRWVGDFLASGPTDQVFAVDAETGAIRFGDGMNGQRPPNAAKISVKYRSGAGAIGNVQAEEVVPGRDFEPIERVRYHSGALLTAHDMQAEQDYIIEGRRRHYRTLHGSGIVSGLEVTVGQNGIVVSPGMAIDQAGQEIVVSAPELIPFPPGCRSFSLFLSSAETLSRHVPSMATAAAEDATEFSRVRESVAFEYVTASDVDDEPRLLLARLSCTAGRWSTADPDQPRHLVILETILCLGAGLLALAGLAAATRRRLR